MKSLGCQLKNEPTTGADFGRRAGKNGKSRPYFSMLPCRLTGIALDISGILTRDQHLNQANRDEHHAAVSRIRSLRSSLLYKPRILCERQEILPPFHIEPNAMLGNFMDFNF